MVLSQIKQTSKEFFYKNNNLLKLFKVKISSKGILYFENKYYTNLL